MLTREGLLGDDFWNAGLVDVGWEEPWPGAHWAHTRLPLLAAMHVRRERYDRINTAEAVPLAAKRGERE